MLFGHDVIITSLALGALLIIYQLLLYRQECFSEK